ncbi:hypothetical protein [Gephyromycinifex aptenodytis]|uniref:hypothetical protein n=1 Tax=Gephyromycinifex aptenodytis TaxID=2716227 RepID=UPI0014466EB7|nr:hypothetical protein [Gephyromycinifex aptenodytis]
MADPAVLVLDEPTPGSISLAERDLRGAGAVRRAGNRVFARSMHLTCKEFAGESRTLVASL